MRVPPPDLDAADVAAVLAVEWGLRAVELRYAPVGFGGHHWVAEVAGRPTWFVTAARPGRGLTAALRTAVVLHEAGVPGVVASVTTELGAVVAGFRGYAISLTPWQAEAVDHPGHGDDVVALLVALHGATDRVRGLTRPDDLAVEGRRPLDAALAALGRPWSGGPYAAAVRDLLGEAAGRVRDELVAHDAVARGIDRRGFVVTHGEVKPGNLLATPHGPVLVDWDTALLAPPERDLWRLPAADHATYAARTGRTPDPAVLEFCARRWDLTDVALYVEELRTAPERTADTETAWAELTRLLAV